MLYTAVRGRLGMAHSSVLSRPIPGTLRHDLCQTPGAPSLRFFARAGSDAADTTSCLSAHTTLPTRRGSRPFGSAQGRLFAKCAKDGAPNRSGSASEFKGWATRPFHAVLCLQDVV
jgi:hypothetical protein